MMKYLTAFSVAAFIAVGASGAQAFAPGLIEAEQVGVPRATRLEAGRVVHVHCHGRTSGTAHRLRGSATGGPSGACSDQVIRVSAR